MAETVEFEPKKLEPPVTQGELLQRIRDANASSLQFSDTDANWITGNVGIGKYVVEGFANMHIVENSNGTDRYKTEGVIYTGIKGFKFNNVETSVFFEKDDLEGQTQIALEAIRDNGLNAQATVVEEVEQEGDNIQRDVEKKSIHIVTGENATEENLAWIVNNRTNRGSFEEYKTFLRNNGLNHIEISGIDRTVWHADMRDRRGEWIYQDGKSFKYPSAIEIDIFTPFSEMHSIDQSLGEARIAIEALTETRLFEKEESGEMFNLRFIGERKNPDKVDMTITAAIYTQLADKIKSTQESDDSMPQTFEEAFTVDLSRVPILPYNESVRLTTLINKNLLSQDKLIAREVICELKQSVDSRWNILLPAADYLPPEEDYRSKYPHSRIDDTWVDNSRQQLLENIKEEKDHEIRGYLVQFVDGSMHIALDDRLTLPQGLLDDLTRFGIEGTMDSVFDKLVLETQIVGRIKQDSALLRKSGLSSNEIALYEHWQRRRLLEKDRRQIPPDKVQWKLDEIEQRLYSLRQQK